MLTLHTWPTPNGKKIFIMLEELGVSYQTHFVDIEKDEQFQPDFLAISPNNKIPALVDHDAPEAPPGAQVKFRIAVGRERLQRIELGCTKSPENDRREDRVRPTGRGTIWNCARRLPAIIRRRWATIEGHLAAVAGER
jgi:hypothetical protein